MCLWSGAWGPRCCSDAWDPGWDRQGEQGGGQQCAADTEVDGHPKGLQVNLKNIMDNIYLTIHRISTDDVSKSPIYSILPWLSFPAFLEASLAPRWKWKGRLSRRNMKVVYIFPDLTISWLNLSSWHKSSHYLFQAALKRSTTSHRHHLRRTGDRKHSQGCCKVSSMNQTASFKVTNQMYYIKSNRLSVWDTIKAFRPVYMYNDQMSVKSS